MCYPVTGKRKREPRTTFWFLPESRKCFDAFWFSWLKASGLQLCPVAPMLTTQDAADVLNVSRPFLIKLLEKGKVLVHKVGNRRKIPIEEVERLKDIFQAKDSRLREYAKNHSRAASSIHRWRSAVRLAAWRTFTDVKCSFKSADQITLPNRRKIVVFNIEGSPRGQPWGQPFTYDISGTIAPIGSVNIS
jgi:excisionase family DNA binding protein